MLPKEAVEQYKALYKKHYGVDLTDAEASLRANNLVRLYRIVLSHQIHLPDEPDDASG